MRAFRDPAVLYPTKWKKALKSSKPSQMRRSCRKLSGPINIIGSVKIDEIVEKDSIIDVIKLTCPGINPNLA